MAGDGRETDITRSTRVMLALGNLSAQRSAWVSGRARRERRSLLSDFPFVSLSVLIILVTLFVMSMDRGGWGWSSWTYSFALVILVPLIVFELKRKAVVTGFAVILLFFMVVIDAGMPGYFGYSPSDTNWYDNWAHLIGAIGLTMFLWTFLGWTFSPNGPPVVNGRKRFAFTLATMIVISFFFEFTEFFTDALFGWRNFHPGIDTTGDLIFDFAGVAIAAMLIGRHRISLLKKPFWHAEPAWK